MLSFRLRYILDLGYDTSMQNKQLGIGAVIRLKNGNFMIVEEVYGGKAWSGVLKAFDGLTCQGFIIGKQDLDGRIERREAEVKVGKFTIGERKELKAAGVEVKDDYTNLGKLHI